MLNLTDLSDHQVKALQNGGAIEVGGEIKTAADFGLPPGVNPELVGSQFEYQTALKRIQELESELSKANQGADGEKVAFLEGFLPTSQSALKILSLEKLKGLAEYRGVEVDGDDKEAYVDALLPKEE